MTKTFIKSLFFLVLGVTSAVTCQASSLTKSQPLPPEKYEEPLCMSSVKTEEDINVCLFATAKFFELQLQEVEEKILQKFSGVQLDRFQESQESWRSLMESDCEIQANFYEGAGIYTAIVSQCLQVHYRTRLFTLKHYLCPEHNLLSGCGL